MNIGTNIYTLRKEKKITQAQLAEKLGVSEQSVSKWENDQCAPDVSLFPIIAEFFGVSIDRLFGYHTSSYSDEIEAIMKAADDSMNTYKEIEIIGEGLKKYPNSPDLKIYLAFSLSVVNRISKNEKERKDAIEKAVKVCNEVVNTCGDIKQVDRALNMLRRIYCEIGEFEKAADAVEKISANGYRQKILGKAQILEYRKDYLEHARFTENNLLECYWIMDALFELKRTALLEQKEYQKVLSWCSAHEKLLSVFDDGCESFYVSHKLWNCEAKAQAYKKLGKKDECLRELKAFASLTKYLNENAKAENYQIGLRNPLYFSTIDDLGTQEEFVTTIDFDELLSRYDAFFENNEQYSAFKKDLKL
jgi:transcriptional regulator with XRE-family HTH domain